MLGKWKEYRYTDLATIIGGGTPKTSVPDYWNGEIPWLSVKDFLPVTKYVYDTEKHISELGLLNSSTKLLEKNDIVISARGTIGAMAMIPYPMCFNQSCFGLRGNNVVDKNFLYYLTRTKVNELRKSAHGSVFDTITKETFDNLRCLVPPLQTQQKIGNTLSSLDSKIELNKRINDNLEQQAQALFNYYFIDTPELLGEFSVGSLADTANYVNGLAMQKYRPINGEKGLPVLKIKELGQGRIDSSSDFCSNEIDSYYKVYDGDVIFSWSGTLMVKIWCGGKCGLNQHLFKVSSKTTPKWFYYFWTKHHLDNFIRIAKDKAVTMGHIKRGELEKAEVLFPNNSVMKKLDTLMAPFLDQIIEKECEIRKLALLRDTLLPKLISGELVINDINN